MILQFRNDSKWSNMSEESYTHPGSPSDSISSTLDDASLSSRQSTCEQNSIRKVSFPEEETDLVTGYLDPPNPWQYAQNVTREDLISSYQTSCRRHGTEPLPRVLQQLKVDMGAEDGRTVDEGSSDLQARNRSQILDLKGEHMDHPQCEPLEEILKRLQFHTINVEDTFQDDEAAVALFDMVEYYEAAKQLNISSNHRIGPRGWQACSQMLKKTRCLEKLVARNTDLSEQLMPALCRGLRIGTHLQILHLENCNLSGRSVVILVNALKTNTALKELHLADNGLVVADAIHLKDLLRANSTLQLLDVSNNNIQDKGVGHICDGLVDQATKDNHYGQHSSLMKYYSGISGHGSTACLNTSGGGLSILVLWNNQITKNSAMYLYKLIANSKTLDTLNIGHNMMTSESLHIMKEALQQTQSLERFGLQSTRLSCDGAVALAECIAVNPRLQRIDLRDNHIQIGGLMALALSMKVNPGVIRLDLDDNPKRKLDGGDDILKQYHALVKEIRGYCDRNLADLEKKEQESLSSVDTKISEVGEESDKSSEGALSPVHNTTSTSRKISLTCETLLRTTVADVMGTEVNSQRKGNNIGGHTLSAEPRRGLGVGARLRSPAPSPVPSPSPSPTPSPTPSPHSSPVPSPSRSRFHVSRVPESSSVSSTEGSFFLSAPTNLTPPQIHYSLASSNSPVQSPLTSSIPTSSSVPSRFKVTLVSEPKKSPVVISTLQRGNSEPIQSTPTVVTSSPNNVTVGFKFDGRKVCESDLYSCNKEESKVSSSAKECREPRALSPAADDEDDEGWNFDEPTDQAEGAEHEKVIGSTSEGVETVEVETKGAVAEDITFKTQEDAKSPSSRSTSCPNIMPCSTRIPPSPQSSFSSPPASKSPYSVPGRIRKFSGVLPPHNLDPEPPPKIQSSLEKLLGLFQHPASLFGKSSSVGTPHQNIANQPSLGVGFFFGSPSALGITRPTKPTETQQTRNNNSSPPPKSHPPSFSSVLISNVMQEVSAMRSSVFPGPQVCQGKSTSSFQKSQSSAKSLLPDSKSDMLLSDSNTAPFPKSEDNCVQLDCHNLGPKNSQLNDNFPKNTILVGCRNEPELSSHSVSRENTHCSLLDSVPKVGATVERKSSDSLGNVERECERTDFGVSPDSPQSGVVSEICRSAEEELNDNSSGLTGLSSVECSIEKGDTIPFLSPDKYEREVAREPMGTSNDPPDPNCNTYSDEVENSKAVKNNEIEKTKIWCKNDEVKLDELSQNLQLDILATCYEQDGAESKSGQGEEIECANVAIEVTREATETIAADLGSTSAANICSHVGSNKE